MTVAATHASDDHLVWYAGYGSNLLRKRFDYYITGGKPEGSTKEYSGCRDKTAPRDDRQIALNHELYFADHSNSWNGAVAFIKSGAANANTYARMYLISYGQFNDVVRQENGRDVPGGNIVPPYDDLAANDQWLIPGIRLYGRLVKTGTHADRPILTFTATRDDFAIGAPSEAYVKMIVSGLEETYPCLRKSEILEYLGQVDGIRATPIQGDLLARWVLGH